MKRIRKIFLSSPNDGLLDARASLPKKIEKLDRRIRVLTFERDAHRYQGLAAEEICFKLVDEADSLVLLLDQNYGNPCKKNPRISITHAEIKRAIKAGKKIIPVVRTGAWYEFNVWRKNKRLKKIKFDYVKDPRLFKILEELKTENIHHYDDFLSQSNVSRMALSINSISKNESYGVLPHTSLG